MDSILVSMAGHRPGGEVFKELQNAGDRAFANGAKTVIDHETP